MAELGIVCKSGGFTTSSGISLMDHENIDSLVHNLSEDTFSEIIRNSNNQVIAVNQFQFENGPLVRKVDITRNSQGQVIQTVEQQYNGVGILIQSLTTILNRDPNGKVITIITDEVP